MEIKFSPTDDEIIRNYLLPKVLGRSNIPGHIVEEKIYSLAPWSLNWSHVPQFYDHERYYFAKRSQVQLTNNKIITNNNRYYCENDAGFWKIAGDKFPIRDSNDCILGYYRTLNFWFYKDLIKKDRRRVFKSQWLMHEYQLPSDEFQEWAFCRVINELRDAKRSNSESDHDDQVQVITPKHEVSSQDNHNHNHHDQVVPSEQQQRQPSDLFDRDDGQIIPGNFVDLLNMPDDDNDHDDYDSDDGEFDYDNFVASLWGVQSQMHQHDIQEDVLIPNLQITRRLIEPPSSIIYPKKKA